MSDHDHGAAYFQTNADEQTLEWKRRFRTHMLESHRASSDFVSLPAIELVVEQHNLEHGRDASGVEF